MDLDLVKQRLGDIPNMTLEQAQAMAGFIKEHRLTRVLELGFAHGVSTCYIAAALAQSGGGRLTTIDRESARELEPNVEGLLDRIGLRDLVTVYYEPTSYIWRLMKLVEENPAPIFDLCYIDGAHTWATDGFAFFLADRLLVEGGWIILDDLDWSFSTSPSLRSLPSVLEMPEEERETEQVRKVYELLVRRHPSYDNFFQRSNWGYAQKVGSSSVSESSIRTEIVYQKTGLGEALMRLAKKVARWR